MPKEIKTKNKWLADVENAFAGINLKCLRIECPDCGKIGLVTTRWVRGPVLKPVYILHMRQNKARSFCKLNDEQSILVRRKVCMTKGDVRGILKLRKPFVLFSGGKDSLATLIYLKEIAKKLRRRLTAVYVDTTAGLPENTEYVKKVCQYLHVKLEVVRPKVDYFTLAKDWGIPSFRYRWCCRELKIKPIEEYFKSIKQPKVVLDGIRAVESNVRSQYIPVWYHPSFKCLSVSPIFRWTDEDVTSLINSNGIPKTLLHSLGSSTECWCGAYKTEANFKKLYSLNKDIFHKLVNVEEANKNRYTFIFKNGEKLPLKKLEKQILREKRKQDG
jgi:3'-phosphoadenosine 5'-phosphosulfate sulfotransferase (PAPS reductase)/FAD synthetase